MQALPAVSYLGDELRRMRDQVDKMLTDLEHEGSSYETFAATEVHFAYMSLAAARTALDRAAERDDSTP